VRLLFIQEVEVLGFLHPVISYDLITEVRVFIDEYFLASLSILDYNASRKSKFLDPQ